MLRINHAVLHVFDFNSCVNVFSQEELDFTSKQPKAYVTKHVRKALANVENMRGEFVPNSAFAGELRAYFAGQRDFLDLSVQIADFISTQLGRMEKAESTDLLVVDFEDEPSVPKGELSEEDLQAAYNAQGKRYFAFIMLESKPAFMHEVGQGDIGTRAEITRHYAILPNPSQKVQSYALVEAGSMDVLFVDKERTIAGEDCMIIPDKLLQCSKQASGKEVLDTVTRIVEEVAQEYGANTATAMSKAKACVAEAAEESDYLAPWDIGAEVFDDEPLQKRFEEAVRQENVPQSVPMKKEAVQRMTRNHKIRTDTGIEITFPAEYCENPDFIEFVSTPNGMISIELKNIGHIENR